MRIAQAALQAAKAFYSGGTINRNGQAAAAKNVRFASWVGVSLFPLSIVLFLLSQNTLGALSAVLGGAMMVGAALAKTATVRARHTGQLAILSLAILFGVWVAPNSAAAALIIASIGFVAFNKVDLRVRVALASATALLTLSIILNASDIAYKGAFGNASSLAFYAIALMQLVGRISSLTRRSSEGEREQVRAFRQLVESVRDAVVKYDTEGKLVYLSHTSEALYGCKRYELMGDGFIERMHLLDRPAYLQALSSVARGKSSKTIDVRMRCDHEEGSDFVWLEVALSSVSERCASDGRAEVIAIIRDVTSRKQQENDLEEAKKMAETASHAKSRFLATIGHELRTPLNAVVGFSDMMLNDIGGELSPSHKEYVDLIRGSGTHLLDTVTMLLDMSKLESGKFEIQTGQMKPEDLIEPCITIVKSAADQKNVKLVTEHASLLPTVVADERACRQVMINLLTNAIKFSEPGQSVRLSIKQRGKSVLFAVTDEGIGISKADVERLGEPFFQAENGLDRKYEGTGLGLSIVKGLVELHEGELHVRSTVGSGTTMTVELPIDGPMPREKQKVLEELSDRRFEEEERRVMHAGEKRAG